MKHLRKKHIAVVALGCAFLATGSIALAQGEPAGSGRDQSPSLAQARSTFSVLNGKTGIPPQILHDSLPVDDLGLDLSQSVRVPAPKDDTWADSWYVVPGSKGVCLALIQGVVCGTFKQIDEHGMLWMLAPSQSAKDVPTDAAPAEKGWQVRALVPDGLGRVSVSGLDRGVTGSDEPHNNVLNLLLPHGGDSYAVRDDSGKVVHEQTVIPGTAIR